MIRILNNRNANNGVPGNTFAIWDAGPNGTDYAPAINPDLYKDRVILHSDWDYVGVDRTLTSAPVVRPAASIGPPGNSITVNLGAHGQGAPPMMVSRFSLDGGTTWNTINGTVHSALFDIYRGRSFVIQADNTNVYAYIWEIGPVTAQTLTFQTHILKRTFGETKPDNNVVFRADLPNSYIEAAGGVFDSRRQYLQTPAAGQATDIYHRTGPTHLLVAGDESQESIIGMSTSAHLLNMRTAEFFTTSWPPYVTTVTPLQLVLSGTGSPADVIEFSNNRVRISNSAGQDILDSSRKMIAYMAETSFSISIPSRGVSTGGFPQEVVHHSWTVPADTNMLMGWFKLTSSTQLIETNKPVDFSSAIVIAGSYAVTNVGGYLFIRQMSIVYPRIVGNQVEIVENWFYNTTGPASPAPTNLPAYTADIKLFACATTGGITP
tara:strand:+ start:1956 stop:3260 length:1305 start_codon:yes stop_codon:yes gene_type:complete